MPPEVAVNFVKRAAPGGGTGNVELLLHELRHALGRLLADGTPHTIDLRAIPLGPGEEDRLLATLGTGEIVAALDAEGASEIRECAYTGIWCITHHDRSGTVSGRFLEVAFVPSLLASPPEDVSRALGRLSTLLETTSPQVRSDLRGLPWN